MTLQQGKQEASPGVADSLARWLGLVPVRLQRTAVDSAMAREDCHSQVNLLGKMRNVTSFPLTLALQAGG